MAKKKFSPMNLSTSFAHLNGEKIVEEKSNEKKLKRNLIMNVRHSVRARACSGHRDECIGIYVWRVSWRFLFHFLFLFIVRYSPRV